jgi:hypothetical protein
MSAPNQYLLDLQGVAHPWDTNELARTTALAIIMATSGAGVVGTTFVVDAATATPHDNVYTTFAQAVAAAAAFAGPKVFQFRGIAPVIAATGTTYNLGIDPITFTSEFPLLTATNLPAALAIADGATVSGGFANFTIDGFSITYAGTTAPFYLAPGSGAFVRLTGNSYVTTTGGFPLLRAGVGNALEVQLLETSVTVSGVCFDAVGAGALMEIGTVGSTLATSTVAQSAGGTTIVLSLVSSDQISLTQAGMPGGLLVVGTNLIVQSSVKLEKGPNGNVPAMQAGSALLVTGVSAAIPVNLNATSVIVALPKTNVGGGATTSYRALATDRVNGLAGSFKLTALLGAGINAADGSTLDWIVVG